MDFWPKIYDCIIDEEKWAERMTKEQMSQKVKETCSVSLPIYLNHIEFYIFSVSVVGAVLMFGINLAWGLIYYLELPIID